MARAFQAVYAFIHSDQMQKLTLSPTQCHQSRICNGYVICIWYRHHSK